MNENLVVSVYWVTW